MYILVSPFSKTFDDTGLVYFVPDFLKKDIQVGQILEIPLREKIEIAISLKFIKKSELDINPEKIKPIIGIKTTDIVFPKSTPKLISWIASYYFTAIHHASSLFISTHIRRQIEKGSFEIGKNKVYNYNFSHSKILTGSQERAFREIKTSKNNHILLHGITGSGKTEVYIKLIKETLDTGKQSLLLIPEIILTSQIGEKIKNVFGDDVLIINSSITDTKKTKYWKDIYSGNAKIVVGTRSSLFYPYKNLGIIIIDEEHDDSYISGNSPRYNSLEVASELVFSLNIRLILGSGTPSIKSMYRAVKGKYSLVSLLEKWKQD